MFLGKLTWICSYIRKPEAKPNLCVGENLKMRFSAAFQQESWKINPFNYGKFRQKQFWSLWPQLSDYSSVHYRWFEDRFPLFFPLLYFLYTQQAFRLVSNFSFHGENMFRQWFTCVSFTVKISKALIQKLDVPEGSWVNEFLIRS